ncbi:MAG TPA: YoaK family protein [Acidimicrobiales bacterium]|nr:YoaK family protein [Acidimicrobiales bacterium]
MNDRSESQTQPSSSLVASLGVLTLVSGFVDAVSFLSLGHVFTANMTGNVVLLGFAVAGAPTFSATASITALAAFVCGTILCGRLARRIPTHRPLMTVVLLFEATLTAIAAIIAAAEGVSGLASGWPKLTVIAVLALGIGARNSAVRWLRVPEMTTTVLTTTITSLVSETSLTGGMDPNAVKGLTSVGSMFVGAIIGAALTIHVHPALPLGLAAVIVVSLAAFFARNTDAQLGIA